MKPGHIDPTSSASRDAPEAPAPRTLAFALDAEERAASLLELAPHHLEHALFSDARAFLERPGKAFRARLVEASFTLVGGDPRHVPHVALEAVELLHAGSLVVDDIQDNADERRGAPALHRTLGVPLALNIGNWLYFVALDKLDQLGLAPLLMLETTRAAHRCLLRCHEGQALDLSVKVAELRRAEVASVVRTTTQLKTGALMSFAARLGASAAGASGANIASLSQFGEQVGIALQMLDDLGSFVSKDRHDKALEDLRGQRVNWVWTWAAECLAPMTYKQLTRQTARGEQLSDVLNRLARAVEPLGRARIHAALEEALSPLVPSFGAAGALAGLRAELARLEQSYG